MRQRYLAFISLFASLPAMAMTFQTRLENVEWKVEGDAFECRLIQPIADFGQGEFVRRAGEQATFRLTSPGSSLGSGSATLLAAGAPWQPGRGDINLGSVRVGGDDVVLSSSQGQATRLLSGLLEGRSTVVRSTSGQAEVRVLPVKFNKAFNEYQACTSKLLPMNFDQVRETQIGFPGANYDLDKAAKRRLDTVIAFMKADPTVNHVELDGHSDNSGNRLSNRDMSRRRAVAVQDYLKANGVPEAAIVVRFHGESYPLVPNTNAANRARNRRVNIELSRVAGTPAPVVPAPVAPVAPAAQAPATAPAAATAAAARTPAK